MSQASPNISAPPPIKALDEATINRIAAGEVVERPASAVKELVENALDAGATRIVVDIAGGGKNLIRITDDGHGMAGDELLLAVSRHATSKLDSADLLNIHFFGFRGEALASLGAVGRLAITSRRAGHDAAQITVTGGKVGAPRPAALTRGSVVELRDLFYATPARLKFLRSERAETQAIADVLRRLAMAQPSVGFTLNDHSGETPRCLLRADPQSGDFFNALHGRLSGLLGTDFIENALRIEIERDGVRLSGYAALPTYSRGSNTQQFIFVNGRAVQDRVLIGALRVAYFDFLSRDRHPAAVLNISCDPERVDVNVHPAKSEVRFREVEAIRSLIISGLRNALSGAGHRASSTVGAQTLAAMRPASGAGRLPSQAAVLQSLASQAPHTFGFAEVPSARIETPQTAEPPPPLASGAAQGGGEETTAYPLGAARAQLHENYIIAQTADGLVIVDQHAAHERLVYERLKQQMAAHGIARQALLIPEIVTLSPSDAAQILAVAQDLSALGLVVEPFGSTAVAIRETPALLGTVDAASLLHDVLDELAQSGETRLVHEKLEAILSRVACHGSVRSGRRMQSDEMNALLREMETTPHSGQCNHGRPTYVELKLHDIERLFGRR